MNDPKQTVLHIAEGLGIDTAEVERRLRFLEFSARDEELLCALHAEIERHGDRSFFVDAFYRHLLAFPPTQGLISDEATLARLKRTQGAYFERLTAGHYDQAYMLDRLRIGLVHERVGLAPQWYLGAYNKYISLLAPRIRAYYRDDPERVLDTLVALLKIVFYDMGLAIDAYIHAAHGKVRAQADQLKALSEIAVLITASLSHDAVMEQILHQGLRLAGVPAACVALYDSATGQFGATQTAGLSEAFVRELRFRPGGLAEAALNSGAPVLCSDHPGVAYPLSTLARAEGIRAFLCLPLVSHAQRIGLLYLYRHDQDSFQPEEIELLRTFAHIAAGAIENAQLHQRTLELASTDALTGLHNRRALDLRLAGEVQRTRRFGQFFSVLMFDIDFFKRINDSHGHLFGDRVLQGVSGVLQRQMRDVDFVARYGGEEFVMLLPGTDGSGARHVGERARAAVAAAELALPDGSKVPVTVSVGVACFPENAETPEQLLARADRALYHAKQTGRDRVCLYRDVFPDDGTVGDGPGDRRL
jgi:diguanylate cyclase (GGDEF)-like protein